MSRQQTAKQVHSLADPDEKLGKIRFIHKDGTEHSFSSCVNSLSGSRLSYFDSDAPTICEDLKWTKSVFKDIRAKAQVLEVIGDF